MTRDKGIVRVDSVHAKHRLAGLGYRSDCIFILGTGDQTGHQDQEDHGSRRQLSPAGDARSNPADHLVSKCRGMDHYSADLRIPAALSCLLSASAHPIRSIGNRDDRLLSHADLLEENGQRLANGDRPQRKEYADNLRPVCYREASDLCTAVFAGTGVGGCGSESVDADRGTIANYTIAMGGAS